VAQPPYNEQHMAWRTKTRWCATSPQSLSESTYISASYTTSSSTVIRCSDASNCKFSRSRIIARQYNVTYIHGIFFSQICHFRPMIQPNPLKAKILDPFPTQPNPWANPTNPWTTLVKRPLISYIHIGQDSTRYRRVGKHISVTGRWVCDDRFYGLVNRSNR